MYNIIACDDKIGVTDQSNLIAVNIKSQKRYSKIF